MTVAASSQFLWYTTRATGVVALGLLTASVVLGILTSVRVGTLSLPRFAVQDLHKRLSLLSVVFIALHVVTTVSDSYAPIGWLSTVVPFTSSYRRLWLGMGTVAVDVLIAVVLTSLVRQRITQRAWRVVHWTSYASWPLALVHGLGTGTDPHLQWMKVFTAACIAAVVAAVAARLRSARVSSTLRIALAGITLAGVLILGIWAIAGPLKSGWAKRAGTPPPLLSGAASSSQGGPSGSASYTASPSASQRKSSSSGSKASALPPPPYQAFLSGSLSHQLNPDGLETVQIRAQTRPLAGVLDVSIVGAPLGGGGVEMRTSTVTFGSASQPDQFLGKVSALKGSRVDLALHDSSGTQLTLRVSLSISGTAVQGDLSSNLPEGDYGST